MMESVTASTITLVNSGESAPPYKAETFILPSGYLLPSIHSWPPFFTQQRNPKVINDQLTNWTRLILSYARHRKLFFLREQDADVHNEGDWSEIFRNPRLKRSIKPGLLKQVIQALVDNGQAVYEPARQTSSVLLYWRRPEEWATLLHEWATNTGQLNTILTFYEITMPEMESPLTDLALPLLRKAIAILTKAGRAQVIEGTDGGGVRFFAK